jgi:hypothetical protein
MKKNVYDRICRLEFLAILLTAALAHANVDEFRLYIPAFKGPDELGRNVATVLNLQIWQTLRREPWPNPERLDFGRGVIVWSQNPLADLSHPEAERKAMEDHIWAQMTFWGEAFPYGDGVIAQTYLSLPMFEDHRENRFENWQVTVPTSSGDIVLQAEPPRRRYEFAPIVLRQEVVQQYSLPSSLKMLREPRPSDVIGEVGNAYIGIEPRGHYQLVYSEGKRGWVYLPQLSQERSEVVDFVGGLIRIFRSDWVGAAALMSRVVDNPSTPTTLKIDALLYKAYAKAQRGMNGGEELREAYRLNPYSQATITYWIMQRLARLIHSKKSGAAEDLILSQIRDIRQLINTHKYLFFAGHPWLTKLQTALDQMSQ